LLPWRAAGNRHKTKMQEVTIMSIGRDDYQERKEARIDRLEERAAHAQAESDATSHAVHKIMSYIPLWPARPRGPPQ